MKTQHLGLPVNTDHNMWANGIY